MKTKSTKLTPNWRLETGVVQKLVGCTTTRGEAPRWLVACPPPSSNLALLPAPDWPFALFGCPCHTPSHTHSHRDTHTNTHSHDGRRSIFIVIRYTNCTRLQEPNVTTLQLVCKGRLHTHTHTLSDYLQQRLPPIYFFDRAAARSPAIFLSAHSPSKAPLSLPLSLPLHRRDE